MKKVMQLIMDCLALPFVVAAVIVALIMGWLEVRKEQALRSQKGGGKCQ